MVETVAELEGSLQHWDMFSDLYQVLREQSAVGRTRLALPIEKICQKENLRIRSPLSAWNSSLFSLLCVWHCKTLLVFQLANFWVKALWCLPYTKSIGQFNSFTRLHCSDFHSDKDVVVVVLAESSFCQVHLDILCPVWPLLQQSK